MEKKINALQLKSKVENFHKDFIDEKVEAVLSGIENSAENGKVYYNHKFKFSADTDYSLKNFLLNRIKDQILDNGLNPNIMDHGEYTHISVVLN
jgi:hypothetical protein